MELAGIEKAVAINQFLIERAMFQSMCKRRTYVDPNQIATQLRDLVDQARKTGDRALIQEWMTNERKFDYLMSSSMTKGQLLGFAFTQFSGHHSLSSDEMLELRKTAEKAEKAMFGSWSETPFGNARGFRQNMQDRGRDSSQRFIRDKSGNARNNSAVRKNFGKCYNCNQTGHFKAACPMGKEEA